MFKGEQLRSFRSLSVEKGAFSVSQMSHNARNVTAFPPKMDEEKMINKIDVKAF